MNSTPAIVATSAAQAYYAALQYLHTTLGPDWIKIDWDDRTLQWRFFQPSTASSSSQGWKIHVSASAAESPSLLQALARVLERLRIPFKVPRCIGDVVFLNSGDAGREQLGKIVTVYPANNRQARAAIEQLDQVWPISRGPEVQTDLHLRPNSAVSFRYGVFRSDSEVVGSTGIHQFALVDSNGSLSPDVRECKGIQSPVAPKPPLTGCPPTEYRIKLNEPVTIDSSEYLPLAVLGDTPRTLTYLAANLATLDTVVIKAGHRGVGGDTEGFDVRDILRREQTILRALHDYPDVAPHVLDWLDDDWPVLVMQDLRGEPLCELSRRARIEALPMLAKTVAQVHEAGFVHGDIKLENAVRLDTGVALIDFELATPIGETIRPGGTRGHLAPEVSGCALAADAARDVYALAGCVVQAVLDIPPGLLPGGAARAKGLLRNEGAADVGRAVAPWLARAPEGRPTAHDAAATLQAAVGRWRMLVPHVGERSTEAEQRWYRRASSDAACAVSDYMQPGEYGCCWRNEHFMREFHCEAINIGAAGILLGLLSVDRALDRTDHTDSVGMGARWLAARPATGKAAGLFTGNAGIALALAVAGLHLNEDTLLTAARMRFESATADRREMDLFSGGAGVVWSACLMHEVTGENWPLEAANGVVAWIKRHATVNSGVPVWTIESSREASYFGCAHGSAGVAMTLAYWGRCCGEPALADVARETFRALVRHGRTADGHALRIGSKETRHHAVGNWCHGVAGYLWAVLNGLGDDLALREEIDWAVEVLTDTMSVGTPTYCHGLAGQLELWHMLESVPRFRDLAQARAGKVARALRTIHIKKGDHCVWSSDDPDIMTPDLWIGFLGPASALAMHAASVCHPLLSSVWLQACAQPCNTWQSGVMSCTPQCR